MLDTSTRESRKLFYNSAKWALTRQAVLERDHYECLWCAAEGKVTTNLSKNTALEVDHIKELEYYPELALDMNNLRTLCKYHHNQRHQRFEFKSNKQTKPKNYREDEWFG
ncbi:TPA: HNH endonuclease [Streptococcus suis]